MICFVEGDGEAIINPRTIESAIKELWALFRRMGLNDTEAWFVMKTGAESYERRVNERGAGTIRVLSALIADSIDEAMRE